MVRIRGFTLFELLLALAVGTVLFGVAVPNFRYGLEAARSADAHASLLGSLALAANKAAITGSHAVLCPSSDGGHCTNTPDWSRGWIVFLDADGDRDADAGEKILGRTPALPGKVRLRSTVGRTRVVFQGNGGNAGSNLTFTLCDGRGAAKAQALILNNQGRLHPATASAAAIASTCVP